MGNFLCSMLAKMQKLFEVFPMEHIVQKYSMSLFHMCTHQHINSDTCEIVSMGYFGNYKIKEKSVLALVHRIHSLYKRQAQNNIPNDLPLNFETSFIKSKHEKQSKCCSISCLCLWFQVTQFCKPVPLQLQSHTTFAAGEFPHLVLVPLQMNPLIQVCFEGLPYPGSAPYIAIQFLLLGRVSVLLPLHACINN